MQLPTVLFKPGKSELKKCKFDMQSNTQITLLFMSKLHVKIKNCVC